MDLKAETVGLAVIMELPMIIVDVQRAGPSTGMPTKTEQADLLLAMYGRHGESPLPIVSASTPAECFTAAIEAARIAVTLPDTGDPALRHVPRRTPRSRGRSPTSRACRRSTRAFATSERRGLPALRARREARATVGGPRHPRARPPDRRARATGRDRQHQLRRREPRADDPAAPGQDRRHRGRHPAAGVEDPTARPSCWCSAGVRRSARSRRRPLARERMVRRSRRRISGT